MKMRYTLSTLAAIATATTALTQGWNPLPSKQSGRPSTSQGYLDVIRRVAGMTSDPQASNLVRRFGFDLVNLTWEDTGRYKGSAVGPNISDMTIQVGAWNERRQYEVSAMPVIRYSNFSDVTGDIAPEDFTLLVGNEDRGRGGLQRVSLREVLEDPTAFLSNPRSWPSRNPTLLAPRDDKVLVSAQACFLPIPKQGIAKFNPVLFNYQSRPGDPAVLTIMATREGTSMTVIDNQRDSLGFGAVWGQRLYFNDRGRRASLTGERLSDFDRKTGGAGSEGGAGMSMVLVIQVPLKQRFADRYKDSYPSAGGFGGGGAGANKAAAERRSDTENAVIGHGETEGPFTEIDNLPIERDPRYPVRVTVQFYKATSTGVVSEADMRQIKDEIRSVYDHADSVGSLVTEGHTGRVTEYWGVKVQPAGWWREFWNRYEQDTGETREDALRRLARLLGPKVETRPVCDLYLRDVLRRR